MLHIVVLLAVVVIMISVMIHYYYYYSKDDTNHLEKHKEKIKSEILTDDMLNSDKAKKEKKRLSLLDTFFICLKKIFHFVCPSLQTMNNSNNDMKMMKKSKRKEMAVGEKLNDTMTTVNKTMPVTTIVVDMREEKLEKLKKELIEIFKDELKKMIEEELKLFKDIIDEKVKVIENKIVKIENNGGKNVKKQEKVVIDYKIVKDLIEKAITKYDSDKTELVDYALESTGGRIIETSGDKSFFDDWSNVMEMPFMLLKPSPRTIIQRTTSSLVPGNAWCFKGDMGYVIIGLSYEIYITAITYEHIHIKNSPSADWLSAPKEFEIFGINEKDQSSDSVFSIGNFTFKANEPPMQTFEIKKNNKRTYEKVKIRIKSNYGAPFTCLYRVRVHGERSFK
uniref:SUN domain-containing protein n=1 Tax=Strongyloides papillosus TaxID=174720 RepID=A0A0N5B7W5_STREA